MPLARHRQALGDVNFGDRVCGPLGDRSLPFLFADRSETGSCLSGTEETSRPLCSRPQPGAGKRLTGGQSPIVGRKTGRHHDGVARSRQCGSGRF